jgi:4-amino-4-deoxy-L-arabinose transferase-like glycosyltransferase
MASSAPTLPGRSATDAESHQWPNAAGGSALRQALAPSSLAILIILGILLPFLGKAYTSDDATFLLQAQQVLTDPLHPTAFDMVFHGERIRLSRDLVTGPVMAYLLVPAVMLGGAEWVAHAVEAMLLAAGGFFTVVLGLRLGQDRAQAAIAGVLVVASPAVLGMTATAMPDVPAMAFAVAGMERLVAAKQSRRNATALVGALLLGIAALSRPHALLLFPCAALLLTDVGTLRSGGRGLVRQWLTPPVVTLVIGILVWGAAVVLTRDPLSGATVTRTSLRRVEASNVAFNLASFLLHWSVAFPLGLLWPALRGRAFLNARRTIPVFVAGLLLTVLGINLRFGLGYGLVSVLLVCYGFDVLADIIAFTWRTRDERHLALVLWLLIGAVTAGYVHLPAKILIPSAPAMGLLISWQFGAATRSRRRIAIVGGTVALSLAVSVLVIRADATFAELGRVGAAVVGSYRARGERVWFDGGSGYYWYALKAGGVPLAETAPFPHAGDVVVAGPFSRFIGKNKLYPHKTLIYQRVFDAPGGRVFHEGSGFHENRVGVLPWAWGTGEFGRIEAWRIGTASLP